MHTLICCASARSIVSDQYKKGVVGAVVVVVMVVVVGAGMNGIV